MDIDGICTFFQPGFGFQQQLVPGMRPGGPHMPNYFVPVVQQGQQGPRPGMRRGAGAQGQQPVPFQQQVFSHQISMVILILGGYDATLSVENG